MEKFKIKVVYELEKDNPFKNTEYLYNKISKKYGLTRSECVCIYRLITNYQIKKYGQNLTKAIDFKKEK